MSHTTSHWTYWAVGLYSATSHASNAERQSIVTSVMWSVCVCLLDITMSCANMAELIQMPFGMWNVDSCLVQVTMCQLGAGISQGNLAVFGSASSFDVAFRQKFFWPLVSWFCMLFVLLSVLWCCWLGGRKGIWPVKNWVVGCWHAYLSGPSWCHCHSLSCFSEVQIGFTVLVTAHRGSPGQRAVKRVCVCCVDTYLLYFFEMPMI